MTRSISCIEMMRHSEVFLRLVVMMFLVMAMSTATHAAPINFSDLLNRTPPVATKRFAYGADTNQFGELWLPDEPGPHPVLVMIHGGCWQASLPGVVLMAYIAEDMREQGFAVWNIEYRRLGSAGAGYPGTFLDIADGVDYLRKMTDEYRLNLSDITVVGHSAGGQLALWAAARSHLTPTSPLYRKDPLQIRHVITLAGINDLELYRNKGPAACGGPGVIDQLVGASERKTSDPYADTSPASMLPLGVRQHIVSGASDPIVPSWLGRAYGSKTRAAGDDADVIEIEGTGHFELIDPDSDAWRKIRLLLMRDMRHK